MRIFLYVILFFNFGFLAAITSRDIRIQAMTTISFFVIFLVMLAKKNMRQEIGRYTGWLSGLYLFISILLFLEASYTYYRYEDILPIGELLRMVSIFAIQPLGAYWFLYVLDKDGEKKFFKIVNGLFWIMVLISFVAYTVYALAGIQIFSGLYTSESIQSTSNMDGLIMRDENLRIGLPIWGIFAFSYYLSGLLVKKKKIYILPILCFFLYMFYIEQTRANLLYYCIASFVTILFMKDSKFYSFIVLFIGFGALIGATPLLLESFSDTGEHAYSTIARIYEIEYFWSVWQNNIWGGMGLLAGNSEVPDILDIVYSPLGIASMNDIGVFAGLFCYMGVIGVLYYLAFVSRFSYILRKYNKSTDRYGFVFLLTLFVYFLLSSLTLSPFDSGRILMVSIYLAMFEYYFSQQKEKRCET